MFWFSNYLPVFVLLFNWLRAKLGGGCYLLDSFESQLEVLKNIC
jgi:hypothetical protein